MSSPLLRGALLWALVAALFAAGGAFGGVLWHRTTTPVRGVVYQHRFLVVGEASARQFAATGHYVVIALALGLVLGAAAALVIRGRELSLLLAVCLAAAGAGLLMAWVGHRLGPPEAAALARHTKDFTRIRADLAVVGLAPYAALPVGALAGLLGVQTILELVHGFRLRGAVATTNLDHSIRY